MDIIKQPINWAIVTVIVLLSATGATLVTQYLDQSKGQ
jgi:hypothetical protein